MAETFLRLRPTWRSTGVVRVDSRYGALPATGAARFRRGKPASLSAAGLFFNSRPVLFDPALDPFLVPFQGAPGRTLRSPPQRTQQSPDMVNVITNSELTFD